MLRTLYMAAPDDGGLPGPGWLWGIVVGLAIGWLVVEFVRRRAKKLRQETAERKAEEDRLRNAADASTDLFAQPDALTGNLKQLSRRWTVTYSGTTYTVRAIIRLKQGPYNWTEYMLDTGLPNDVKRYLSVETVEGDLEVILWEGVKGEFDLVARKVDYDDVVYHYDEGGTASYEVEGDIGMEPRGSMQYRDFVNKQNAFWRHFSLERFGDAPVEASRGQDVLLTALGLHPPTGSEV